MTEERTELQQLLDDWGIDPVRYAGETTSIELSHAEVMSLVALLTACLEEDGAWHINPEAREGYKALFDKLNAQGFVLFKQFATKIPDRHQGLEPREDDDD